MNIIGPTTSSMRSLRLLCLAVSLIASNCFFTPHAVTGQALVPSAPIAPAIRPLDTKLYSVKSIAALESLTALSTTAAGTDVDSYNLVFHILADEGEWEVSVALLRNMEEKGLIPDLSSFNSLVDACSRAGKHEGIKVILSKMKQHQVQLNIRVYNRVMSSYAKARYVSCK